MLKLPFKYTLLAYLVDQSGDAFAYVERDPERGGPWNTRYATYAVSEFGRCVQAHFYANRRSAIRNCISRAGY